MSTPSLPNVHTLNLPSLSQELNQELIAVGESFDFNLGYNPIVDTSSIDPSKSAKFHAETKTIVADYRSFPMSQELSDRIKSETTDDIFPFSLVNFYFQLIDGGNTVVPHVDTHRPAALVYNVSADNAVTYFYKKKITDENRFIFTTDEISELIDSYKLRPFKWHVLNTGTPHSVQNITKRRIAITCVIPYKYEDVYNHHKNNLLK